MKNLPKPECELGYPNNQILEITGERYQEFCDWMYGQTMALCPEHGGIVYYWDLVGFLRGLPITD